MPMRAGRLRHSVTIWTVTRTADNYGGMDESWAILDTVFASVEPISARELLDADKLEGELTHRITIRYGSELATLAADDVVVLGTRAFQLTGPPINRDEAGEMLTLLAKEDPSISFDFEDET